MANVLRFMAGHKVFEEEAMRAQGEEEYFNDGQEEYQQEDQY